MTTCACVCVCVYVYKHVKIFTLCGSNVIVKCVYDVLRCFPKQDLDAVDCWLFTSILFAHG